MLCDSGLYLFFFFKQQKPLEGFLKHWWLGPIARVPDVEGLDWGLRIYISNRFHAHADLAPLGITLQEQCSGKQPRSYQCSQSRTCIWISWLSYKMYIKHMGTLWKCRFLLSKRGDTNFSALGNTLWETKNCSLLVWIHLLYHSFLPEKNWIKLESTGWGKDCEGEKSKRLKLGLSSERRCHAKGKLNQFHGWSFGHFFPQVVWNVDFSMVYIALSNFEIKCSEPSRFEIQHSYLYSLNRVLDF